MLFSIVGLAQHSPNEHELHHHNETGVDAKKPAQQQHRCHTMEVLEAKFANDPALKAQFEANQAAFAKRVDERYSNNRRRPDALNITIPVVVHVVMPNPNAITTSQIERQLQRLTTDYLGDNPDSTNLNAAFQSVRGRSGIKFVLAKQDPNGACTDGITRTATTVSNFNLDRLGTSNVKRGALGGKDGWDYTKYLNIWVCQVISTNQNPSGGILGFATFPDLGTYPAADQGVVIAAAFFGEASSSCGVDGTYSLGRTLTHEVGHYLNLYHTFQGGCGGNGDEVSDTPPVSNPYFGCGTGVIATGLCTGAANPPGRMYQNYMDYTDDACMTMFSAGQVARMETALASSSALTSLATSNKATPIGPNDAAWFRYTGTSNCTPVSGCNSASITPAAMLKNNGSANLTSATILVKVNGNIEQTVNWTGTILPDSVKAVTGLNPVVLATAGINNVSLEITSVNGGADACSATNTISIPYNAALSPIINLPITENFETGSFPSTGWSIAQSVSDNFTWSRAIIAGPNCSTGSALLNHYDYQNIGRTDDLRTPRINVIGQSAVNIRFDVAHRQYASPASFDRLQVLVSTDCGLTFTSVYDKSGSVLSTGTPTNARFVPTLTEWRTESIAVPATLLTAGNILVAFRTTNDWGNNIYIDNINVTGAAVQRDVRVSAIISPTTTVQCTKTIVPVVRVANLGTEAVTGFTIAYRVNNGTAITQNVPTPIPVGGSIVFNLPATSTGVIAGRNEITAYTSDPITASGTGDQFPGNDFACGVFNVRNVNVGPVVNGFELPNFPSPGVASTNYPEYTVATTGPTTRESFARRAPGSNSPNSVYINNYDLNRTGQLDAIFFPAISTVDADAIKFEFDLAHKNFGTALDSLILQYSTDCGVTYRNSSFAFAGATLATAGSTTSSYAPASASDWKRRKVVLNGVNLATGSIVFRFLHKGAFGNNIFIDNVNIEKVYKRNLKLTEIVTPQQVICTPTSPVTIKVTNLGTQTITGFKAAYTIDGGAPVVTTITGVSLAADSTALFTLTNLTAPSAANSFDFKVYTFDPVSVSGTGDEFVSNDSAAYKVFVTTSVTTSPFEEKFEGNLFPPASWGIRNADLSTTWSKASTGFSSNNSAALKNRSYTSADGFRDELYSPNIIFGGANIIIDSLFLKFDMAASTYNYPGSTLLKMDTLEVLYSTDCGITTTSIYKKWGEDLQSINDPNSPNTTEFIPSSNAHWRSEKIDISAIKGAGNAQFIFRNYSNNGNNIYIDNVNVSKVTFPDKLRFNGFIVMPTVSTGNYTIKHIVPPTTLRALEVYNSQGQLVYRKQYTGEAGNMIDLNLTNLSSGIYELRMRYTDKKITQRIIKQ